MVLKNPNKINVWIYTSSCVKHLPVYNNICYNISSIFALLNKSLFNLQFLTTIYQSTYKLIHKAV